MLKVQIHFNSNLRFSWFDLVQGAVEEERRKKKAIGY